MPLPPATTAALQAAGLTPQPDAPLHKRTYWRVGGPADGLLRITSLDALRAALRITHDTGCACFVLGNGSNLLISDRGLRGLVLLLAGELAGSEREGELLRCGGGLKLVVLLARAAKAGWPGLACLAGIPGTLGGAVRMNAGTQLGELSAILHDVALVLADGSLSTQPAAALRPGYRHTTLPEGAVIASARLRLSGDFARDQRQMRAHLDHRKQTQPLDLPSCGSTFRNPPGDHAGRLIEAAGLKGYRVGGAAVSDKHANFVVNLGGATANDILAVITKIEQTVRAHFGIELVREVHLAGEWS